MGHCNAFALPPQSPNQGPLNRGPSICRPPATWHPTRASAWTHVDTCGILPCVHVLCATCASCEPPAALPRGLSATLHPRGGPAHHVSSPAGPARHVSTLQVSKFFFRDLNKNIYSIEIQIKIQKFLKYSEI